MFSWRRITTDESFPRRLFWIANWVVHISLNCSTFDEINQKTPFSFPKMDFVDGCHCADSCFYSGLMWVIHVRSQVTMWKDKSSRSFRQWFKNSRPLDILWSLYWLVSILITNLAHNLWSNNCGEHCCLNARTGKRLKNKKCYSFLIQIIDRIVKNAKSYILHMVVKLRYMCLKNWVRSDFYLNI